MKATQQDIPEVQIDAPRPNAVIKVFNNSGNDISGRVDALEARTVSVVARSQVVGATVTLKISY